MVTFEDGTKSSTAGRQATMDPPANTAAADHDHEDHDEKHHDDSDDDLSDAEEGHNEVEHTWDEGGPSDCGYHQQVHESFMAAGAAVHSLVGDPSHPTRKWQTTVSNWFQEMSYAARDLLRGEEHLATDAQKAVETLFSGNKDEDNDDDDDEKKDGEVQGPATGTSSGAPVQSSA